MASRFSGRDYNTLREEIISFLRQRLPRDWDYTNLADPIVVFAESLARVGDQLHYTIDELRRECDMATAKRASSIYSYAMREGYKMMLPRGSFGTLSVTSEDSSNRALLSINKFDEIKVLPSGAVLLAKESVQGTLFSKPDATRNSTSLYALNNDPTADSTKDLFAYINTANERVLKIPVVLGKKMTYTFSYNDINTDSTVELPDAFIDRDTLDLTVGSRHLDYVDDIIGSGFNSSSFTLTPKFIGGATILSIEFPTNYRDIYSPGDNFTFTYVSISNEKIEPTVEPKPSFDLSPYISDAETYDVDCGAGIKGYTEYEDPVSTRNNYKHYVQNYAALLTKDDYVSYVKASTPQQCMVFDHSDMYKQGVLPDGAELIERTIYVITDAPFSGRKALWEDLKERSARSDCIIMVPFGKYPYSIVVKADCYLVGTSVSDIATQIKSELLKYYNADYGEKYPDESMINYIVHKASDKVVSMQSCIVLDSTYGTIDTTFNDTSTYTNSQIEAIYQAIIGDKSVTDAAPEHSKLDALLVDGLGARKYFHISDIKNTQKIPSSFPVIYRNNGKIEIHEYEDLVMHQSVYGELDSSTWDISDIEIFDSTEALNITQIVGANDKSMYEDIVGKPYNETNPPVTLIPEMINKLRLNYSYDQIVAGLVFDKCNAKLVSYSNSHKDTLTSLLSSILGKDESDIDTLLNNMPAYLAENITNAEANEIASKITEYVTAYDDTECKLIIEPSIISKPTTLEFNIRQDYVNHHYMVPVLNNIIILINAVSK